MTNNEIKDDDRNVRLSFADAHGEREHIFTAIYEQNVWRDGESVSGRGSSLSATETLRIALTNFLAQRGIKSVIDIPCGDYNWFKAIDYPLDQYTGYDIVKELVDTNNARYGSPTVQFKHANILTEPLEEADLAICRDFVIHSSNEDIFTFFTNLKRSRIPHVLLSQYGNCENRDIDTGNRYRPIDFTQAPFFLPQPEELLDENIRHMYDTANRHAADPSKPLEKYLAYWSSQVIFEALDTNPLYRAHLSRQSDDQQKPRI